MYAEWVRTSKDILTCCNQRKSEVCSGAPADVKSALPFTAPPIAALYGLTKRASARGCPFYVLFTALQLSLQAVIFVLNSFIFVVYCSIYGTGAKRAKSPGGRVGFNFIKPP